MDDQIIIAHDGIYITDGRADLFHVALAPLETDGVFDAAFHFHHFEEFVVEQAFQLAVNERVEIPELVGLHEVGVIVGCDEIGIGVEEQIGDVVQVDEAVEFGRADAVLFTQFVTEEAGGFFDVVDENTFLGGDVGGVMIHDEPVRFVEAGFEIEVADPGGFFAEVAEFPVVVMEGFEGDVGLEKVLGETLQEDAGDETVEVAFVS